ncbi:MAG: hypothetical protein U0L05_09195 [Schaedlerella sp.]|nr:hypothetical protein [Schaedlerella sp.]
MRKVKIAIVGIFVLTSIVFGVYTVKSFITVDRTPPVINSETDVITVSVQDEEKVLFQGLTAEDDKDGDLTDSIRVFSMSHFISESKRTISYIVFNEENLATTYERTMEYTDYVSPKIYMTEPLRYNKTEVEKADFTKALTASDCLDGDLTAEIRAFSDTYFYNITPGSYPVIFQVSNSAGDTCTVSVDVIITDSLNTTEHKKYYPMLSNYIVYTSVNKPVDLRQYLIGVKQNNIEHLFEVDPEIAGVKENITISGSIDYATPGVYPMDCSYTSIEGITAVTKAYIVVESEKNAE